jgi:phosphatidylglycerophosphate synthase
MKHPKIKVAEVRASINYSVQMDLSIRYFGRPLANIVTPFFHNRGWTANQLTVVRLFYSLAGVAILAIPMPILWPIAAVVFYTSVVLDCVDGNLARMQKDVSYLGKFLDGIADMISPLVGPFAASIGCWLYFDQPILLVVGAAVSITSAVNQMLRSRLSFVREWMVGQTGDLTEAELAAAEGPRQWQKLATAIMLNGHFVAVAAVFIPQYGSLMFLSLAIPLQLLPDGVWIGATMAESGALLRRGRESRHSAKN